MASVERFLDRYCLRLAEEERRWNDLDVGLYVDNGAKQFPESARPQR